MTLPDTRASRLRMEKKREADREVAGSISAQDKSPRALRDPRLRGTEKKPLKRRGATVVT